MQTCEHCNSNYDETKVNVPKPIPDGMCAFCGTQLTPDQIKVLVEAYEKTKGA
jgi:hypothetical protein